MSGDSQPLFSAKHGDCVMIREATLEAMGMVKRFETNSWEYIQGNDVIIGITEQAIFDYSLDGFNKFLDQAKQMIKETKEIKK